MSEFKNKVNEIKKRVHRTTLYISTNLREEDKTRFMEFANSQFKGDYGLSLRWLLDLSEGFFMKPDEVLKDRIDLLADEIAKINQNLNPEVKEKKGRKMLSGKIITKLEE